MDGSLTYCIESSYSRPEPGRGVGKARVDLDEELVMKTLTLLIKSSMVRPKWFLSNQKEEDYVLFWFYAEHCAGLEDPSCR